MAKEKTQKYRVTHGGIHTGGKNSEERKIGSTVELTDAGARSLAGKVTPLAEWEKANASTPNSEEVQKLAASLDKTKEQLSEAKEQLSAAKEANADFATSNEDLAKANEALDKELKAAQAEIKKLTPKAK